MWLLCTESLCYDDKKTPSAAREKNIPRDAHSLSQKVEKQPLGASFSRSVFCLKIPFKTNTHNSVYNTLFRPSLIRYVPLLSQRNLLVLLQHTDTHSVYFSLPFCKPESSLLSSCPWLN